MNNSVKSKPLSLVFVMLLVAALIGGIFLVGQKQETRRGAYFSGAKLLIQPETITAAVGDEVPVQLWVQTDKITGSTEDSKVTSVDTKICYGQGLGLEASNVSGLVTLNEEAFRLKAMIKNTDGCLRLAIGSGDIATADLKSGMVKVASIKFKALKAGSGNLQIQMEGSTVGGYNPEPGATDISMKIAEVKGATYTISGEAEPTLTSTPTGEFPWLKFRMAFLGISPAGKCADTDQMPLKITVRSSNGVSKTYSDVIATRENNTGGVAFYDVKLKLVDFNYHDNVAVFVKGPKHLQVKYGVNNQDKYYDKAGGELMALTDSESDTPVFSFEKYPLLPGDITGPGGVQDGQVDGQDFSKVKTAAANMTSVNEGEFLLTDLNGNCTMESQDVALLMLSLAVKQGQLY